MPSDPIPAEAVDMGARALHEVSDDVLPFDLPALPANMGNRYRRRRERERDERHEHYVSSATAVLAAALPHLRAQWEQELLSPETVERLAIDLYAHELLAPGARRFARARWDQRRRSTQESWRRRARHLLGVALGRKDGQG